MQYTYGQVGVFLRAIRKREQNQSYSANVLNWLSTHATDGEAFFKTLRNSLDMDAPKKKNSQGKAQKTGKNNNDIDDFISFMQSINT